MKTRLARVWTASSIAAASRHPAPRLLRSFFTTTAIATAPTVTTTAPRAAQSRTHLGLLALRFPRSPLLHRLRPLRFLRSKSDKAQPQHVNPTPHLGSPEPAPSLSQRLKQLSREYGWTAVGVYFALSVLDFPFCFLAVRLLGTDRIGHYEDVVKSTFWSAVRVIFPDAGKASQQKGAAQELEAATAREGDLTASEVAARANASIWTQLGLAYLVHKSFIFVRVPLAAAVLPKVVKTLRKWGYNIGRKKPRPA